MKLSAVVLLACLLQGCGLQGKLYLPPEPEPIPPQASPIPPGDTEADSEEAAQ